LKTEIDVTILYSDMIRSGNQQHLEDAIMGCLEENKYWLTGLDALIYCRNEYADPTVSVCAKIRSRLQLSKVLPLTLAPSDGLVVADMLKMLEWLMTGGNFHQAICIHVNNDFDENITISSSHQSRLYIFGIKA
jgi:hypothetical protein